MSAPIQLIVGLGNPGAEYEHTRHNAGAWFVAALAEMAHVSLRAQTKLQGWHCQTTLFQHECHLFIPSTFMNHSGQAVRAVASYYKIPAEAILVAHDEIDLSVGDIRLKFDGGHGGHNGLRDIISHLNTKQFHRLRIGVGHPRQINEKEVADYVLTPPKNDERQLIDAALQQAEGVMSLVLEGEIQKATQQLHTEKS